MKYIILTLLFYSQVLCCAEAQLVEVFTSRSGAISELSQQAGVKRPYQLVIHDLGAVEAWEKSFSVGLPGNEEQARKVVDSKIAAMGKGRFEAEINEAYEPLKRAITLGLMEFPAVVIDGKYTIYGTDSVDLALNRYQKWKQSKTQP